MFPPSLMEEEYLERRNAATRLAWWVRLGLVGLVLVPTSVFAVALLLDPYRDGRVWLEEIHTQMRMDPCTFRRVTGGYPCPACGMTSSFALFIRGDLWHSVQANFAGTFLAIIALLFIPWALISAWRGRLLWVRSAEDLALRVLVFFAFVMFLRWGVVLLLRFF